MSCSTENYKDYLGYIQKKESLPESIKSLKKMKELTDKFNEAIIQNKSGKSTNKDSPQSKRQLTIQKQVTMLP